MALEVIYRFGIVIVKFICQIKNHISMYGLVLKVLMSKHMTSFEDLNIYIYMKCNSKNDKYFQKNSFIQQQDKNISYLFK